MPPGVFCGPRESAIDRAAALEIARFFPNVRDK
jgi:hypothetical protein